MKKKILQFCNNEIKIIITCVPSLQRVLFARGNDAGHSDDLPLQVAL